MPRTTTGNFDTENALTETEPVALVAITGITRRYSSGTFGNIGANDRQFIQRFEHDTTEIDIQKGGGLGTSKSRIVIGDHEDNSFDVTQELVIDGDIFEENMTLSLGYQALNDTDFMDIALQRIVDFKENINTVEVITEDAKRLIGKNSTIFNVSAQTLVNDGTGIAPADTTITVDSTTGFVDPGNIDSEIYWIYPAIIVSDTEIMLYNATTATTFTAYGRGALRYGSTATYSHDDNAEVKQAFTFNRDPSVARAGPMKTLLAILLTRWEGSSRHAYYDLADYDTNFRGFGLGLTSADVDITSFESLDGKITWDCCTDQGDGDHGRIAIVWEPTNALTWITEYLRLFGCFMYINASGQLAVETYDYLELAIARSADITVAVGDVNQDGSFVEMDYTKMVNYVEIAYDKNWLEGTYNERSRWDFTDSVNAYNRQKNVVLFEFDHFDPNQDSQEIRYGYLRRLFYLFGNPPSKFKIRTHHGFVNALPGDIIDLSCDFFRDVTGASVTRGWTNKNGMITKQRIIWIGNKPSVELEGFVWDGQDKVDLATDITSQTDLAAVWDSSGGRSDIDIGGTDDNTLEAQDAYIDYSPTINAEAYRVEITVTPPVSGNNRTILFDLGIHSQNPATTDLFSATYDAIRYDTEESAFNLVFYFTNRGGASTVARFKVDATNAREPDGTAAIGADLADVDIVSLITYQFSTNLPLAATT